MLYLVTHGESCPNVGEFILKEEFRDINERSLEWVKIPGSNDLAFEKILNRDLSTGVYTRLLKFHPGYEGAAETEHEFWEEVYVIEGEMIEKKRTIKQTAGNYECMPPHTKHGPYASKKGCIMFEVSYR